MAGSFGGSTHSTISGERCPSPSNPSSSAVTAGAINAVRVSGPVFDELRAHAHGESLWQTSHVGGHRFAANVLVLPAGILLGRVRRADAPHVAAELRAGRIPLAHYRGRRIHAPEAQAADAALREHLHLTGIADVTVLRADGGRVSLATPSGVVEAVVETGPGRCSARAAEEPGASLRYSVRSW